MTAVADGPRKVSVAWRERMVEMEYAWIAPERTASSGALASSPALTYHWSVSHGSITTPPRSP